jgi:hypothetical protein
MSPSLSHSLQTFKLFKTKKHENKIISTTHFCARCYQIFIDLYFAADGGNELGKRPNQDGIG